MNANIDATAENAVQALPSDAGDVPDDCAVTAKEASPNSRLLNAAKNGSRLRPLKIGELPKPLERVERAAREYRRYLEAAVLDARGEISHNSAHRIDEAVSWSIHADTCRWLLRQKLPVMTATDIAKCSREIASAKSCRNKAVRELRLLDPADIDPWMVPPASPDDPLPPDILIPPEPTH